MYNEILTKTWVRIVVSLFLSGMVTEIIAISSADPNRATDQYSTFRFWLFAVTFYLVITGLVKKSKTNA